MENKKTYYITTPIYYPSGKWHLGHSYTTVCCDAIARYKRMRGFDVFYLTGTDEHGQKIELKAAEKNMTPKAYVDERVADIKKLWELLDITFDKFIRTTDDYHEAAVSKIFDKLYEQGDIYKSVYKGKYCTPCESFWTESQLVDGKCPDCGREVIDAEEESYFFRLSAYADKILKLYEDNPEFLQPKSRMNEMINNFLKPGLQDLCVSRTSVKWGVPVDFDPNHTVYVWIDALSNYITALGYDTDEENCGELYKKYWPANIHIIGKDILRFHTIYWPIILMALGQPLPKQIFGHAWFLNGVDKMSKSKGNTMYADDLCELFGVDAVRLYLLGEMPYNADGTITYEAIIKKYNAELANNLGNLVSRTVAMTKKYFGGEVPTPSIAGEPVDEELFAACRTAADTVREKMNELRVAEAVDAVFTLLSRANKYIDETTPWVLAKSEEGVERLRSVIYNLLETIRHAAVLLAPFMPATSEKILGIFECKADWNRLESFGQLQSGTELNDCGILFARIDEEKMLSEIFSEKE